MDALPSTIYLHRCRNYLISMPLERRYATYKAFYYPQTPASYEPPHFRPGDSENDRYFFSTHGKDEVPERWSIGKLETSWHGWVSSFLRSGR